MRRLFALAADMAGSSNPARMATMAITTSNSTSVKPRSDKLDLAAGIASSLPSWLRQLLCLVETPVVIRRRIEERSRPRVIGQRDHVCPMGQGNGGVGCRQNLEDQARLALQRRAKLAIGQTRIDQCGRESDCQYNIAQIPISSRLHIEIG